MNPSFKGNWVDLVVLFISAFFVFEGLRVGFLIMLVDFIAFFSSLLISLQGYTYAAGLLRENFSLSRSLANALGFLFTAIVAEALVGTLLARLLTKLPEKYRKIKGDRALSVLPAIGEAFVLSAFILTLVVSFPVAPKIKADIAASKIGGYLVAKTSGIEARFQDVFGGVIKDSLTYLTITPGSTERITITSEKGELSVDEVSEAALFEKVNQERQNQGLTRLEWFPEAVPVARAHAQDMWERGYFGHVSPEDEDVGDRLEKANISFSLAGENLALAPTVDTAHTGLMNSEGHRRNILDERYSRMAIGVIDNGLYGKMFVQIFLD